ncbi:MAG: hypothetical protein KF785_01665 [Gemmatimonadales bacterium]|nr:hypothetical protein [Gemmatimonadales bacterium]
MSDFKSLRPPERSATDIARELREHFTRSLYEVTGAQAQPDPVLGALFHALAVQVDRVYQEADQVFFAAALDDLIRGLGMPARLARPAQAVVQFSQLQGRETISSETELIGYQATGAQAVFTPDAPVDIAPTEIVFAAVAEAGRLSTLPGARLPWVNQPILPGNSTPIELSSAAPTLFLAFETDAEHLSRIGLYVEAASQASPILAVLARSPWQLLDGRGQVTERGVLRSSRTRGGMQRLDFVKDRRAATVEPGDVDRLVPLVGGVYGANVWLMPELAPDRRWRSGLPPAIAAAVPRVLPPGHERALDRQLAWLQVPLPAGSRGVASQIARVAVNCVTASNIEAWNEQIDFGRMGAVVSHRPLGATDRHIMGVLGVTGESGTPYLDISDLEAPPGSGRYRYRGNARFEFTPAKQASGRYDGYGMMRLLYCDGEGGNGIAVGEIKQIRSELARNPTARVANLTPTRGGAAPPAYTDARDRFAELLRTRERVVTPADIEIAAKATEPRIGQVKVASASQITDTGLELVTDVTVSVSPEDFADPEAELERLRTELEQYLGERCMIGQQIRVAIAEERRAS